MAFTENLYSFSTQTAVLPSRPLPYAVRHLIRSRTDADSSKLIPDEIQRIRSACFSKRFPELHPDPSTSAEIVCSGIRSSVGTGHIPGNHLIRFLSRQCASAKDAWAIIPSPQAQRCRDPAIGKYAGIKAFPISPVYLSSASTIYSPPLSARNSI